MNNCLLISLLSAENQIGNFERSGGFQMGCELFSNQTKKLVLVGHQKDLVWDYVGPVCGFLWGFRVFSSFW
jgi:hypothetical protein